MNLNIPNADTMQGRKARIHKMVVRFYKSLTCKFSSDGKKWDEIFFQGPGRPDGHEPERILRGPRGFHRRELQSPGGDEPEAGPAFPVVRAGDDLLERRLWGITFTHERFDPSLDFVLAKDWVESRGKYTLRQEWLPDCGFVISRDDAPVFMFFIYFDPSCVVGFLDWAITRPGQLLNVTMAAWNYALAGPIRKAMFQHHATTILTRSPRSMAHQLLKTPGWQCDDVPLFATNYQFSAEDLIPHESLRFSY